MAPYFGIGPNYGMLTACSRTLRAIRKNLLAQKLLPTELLRNEIWGGISLVTAQSYHLDCIDNFFKKAYQYYFPES
jgi:hypothetical protein